MTSDSNAMPTPPSGIPAVQPPPPAPQSGPSGCRMLIIVGIFAIVAIAIIAACGIIAYAVAESQGYFAEDIPTATAQPRPLQIGSPIPTLAPTNTPTATPTNTPIPTNTPTETPVPTETPEPTNTPRPTNPPVVQQPAAQPTAAPAEPAAPAPPAASARGLSATFSVENTTINAGEKAWFNFVLNNPSGSAVNWEILGAAVERDGQNQSDLFQTSWTAPNEYAPLQPGQSLQWRDGATLPSSGTYVLHLAICYANCGGAAGEWEYLGPAATVTVN